jgi:hypothetical protein
VEEEEDEANVVVRDPVVEEAACRHLRAVRHPDVVEGVVEVAPPRSAKKIWTSNWISTCKRLVAL